MVYNNIIGEHNMNDLHKDINDIFFLLGKISGIMETSFGKNLEKLKEIEEIIKDKSEDNNVNKKRTEENDNETK